MGAISPTGSAYFLPAREECIEAFHWLAQEIREAKGEALVLRVEQVVGKSEQQIIGLFCAARQEEYAEIETQAAELEQSLATAREGYDGSHIQPLLAKLRRRHAEIARIDYFHCPAGARAAEQLTRITAALQPEPVQEKIPPAVAAEYQGRVWVTRPNPHVDRLACIWLIRRFIDDKASVRYDLVVAPGEIAFDMEEGRFGHRGSLCTFETLVNAFGLDDHGLRAVGEVVHEIDLRDGRYVRPEIAGVDAVLTGWRLAGLSDLEMEAQGVALFEGLYQAYRAVGRTVIGSPEKASQDGP
jgi:ribosomal protein L29